MNPAKFSKQDAVYWAPGTPDEYGGTEYDTPIAIKVRWEDVDEQVYIKTSNLGDNTTKEQMELAQHYIMADQALVLGGLLWQGLLADWTGGTPNPKTPDVHRIGKVATTPTINARNFLYEAWL